MAPKNFEELELMLEFACNNNYPIAIRYPRGGEDDYKIKKSSKIELGKSEILKSGSDITIVAIGKFVSYACLVAEQLKNDNINVEIINARFASSLDVENIQRSVDKTKCLVTLEDNCIINGFGQSVVTQVSGDYKYLILGYNTSFIKYATVSKIEHDNGLDVEGIYNKIKKNF